MSTYSLAPPVYVLDLGVTDAETLIGRLTEEERNYYAKFLANALTEEDDLEDEHLALFKRMQYE